MKKESIRGQLNGKTVGMSFLVILMGVFLSLFFMGIWGFFIASIFGASFLTSNYNKGAFYGAVIGMLCGALELVVIMIIMSSTGIIFGPYISGSVEGVITEGGFRMIVGLVTGAIGGLIGTYINVHVYHIGE